MTTISAREQDAPGVSFNPFASLYGKAATALLVVSMAMVGAIHASIVVTEPQVTRQAILSTLTRELDGLRMEASCDLAGETTTGRRNCLDMSGFRIVKDAGYRVFSLRYSKPVFIFGIDHGLEVVNEHIPAQQVDVEASAFIRYLAP